MTVKTTTISIKTSGFCDAHDISDRAGEFIAASGLKDGLLTVFVPGSTAGVTTIEFESGAVRDLSEAIEWQVPEDGCYHHNERWHDGNGFSHIRAALIGPSLTVPFRDGRITLGTWQQIVLLDFDNGPRKRDVVLQVMGE